MPALSFRFRILLAISLVVGGVTAATLLVTQNRMRAAWFRAFDEMGRQQMDWFSSAQKDRLVSIRQACLETARKTELADAMKRRDWRAAYTAARADLIKAVEPDTSDASGPRPPGGQPQGASERIRQAMAARAVWLLDADEEVISQPEEDLGNRARSRPGGPERGNPAKGFLQKMAERIDLGEIGSQEIGIVPPPVRPEKPGEGRPGDMKTPGAGSGENKPGSIRTGESDMQLLLETIVTPIPDPAGGPALGAVVLGVPLPDFGESAMRQFNRATSGMDFQSGIWLDGKIYTRTIRKDEQAELLRVLPAHVNTGSAAERAFELKLNGRRWRVVCEVLNPETVWKPATHVSLYSLNPLAEEEQTVMRQVLAWGGIALAAGILAAWLLSRSLARPLTEVAAAAEQIRLGQFSVSVPVRSRDEVGRLAESFNHMAAGLAAGRRYQTLLSQLADPEVAGQLMSGEVTLGGELRDVTVIFCDIRGFTAASEKMPPEEVIAMLNEHMTAMTAVVHAHRGVVDKFVGDLIMALFAAPRAYGDDTLQAARAARAMLAAREKLNASGTWKFDVGIGVATGIAVAGCMGSEARLDYTVLGRRVNLASRLCSVAGRGEILIDDETRARLANCTVTEPVTGLELKGLEAPVHAWRLVAVTETSQMQP